MIMLLVVLPGSLTYSQYPAWWPYPIWEIGGPGICFNIETTEVNRDGKPDIIIGNWNDTYIYFGGPGVLDTTVDLTYRGRCIAICDYNGDGLDDMICIEFTVYDSTRDDYDGNMLYYYGSNGQYLFDTIPSFTKPLPTRYPGREEFGINFVNKGVLVCDLNKDGKKDIVIRGRSYPNRDDLGKLYVYMGKEIPQDTADFSAAGYGYIAGLPPEKQYGNYFSVGDFNADGYDDLVFTSKLGAVGSTGGFQDSLAVLHIYYGSPDFTFYKNEETIKYQSRISKQYPYVYGWLNNIISAMDINGDSICDLMVRKDTTYKVHYGSLNGIDTIPSFIITDPDTTRTTKVGEICFDIGDINSDGYNDFLLTPADYLTFSVHLGGPYINNSNPYGLRGYLNAYNSFPDKAINVGDQKGDGDNDFGVIVNAGNQVRYGYAIIYNGNKNIHTSVKEEERNNLNFDFDVQQNYPNPFNPVTIINYSLTKPGNVEINIYDLRGKAVSTPVKEYKAAGDYKLEFDAGKLNISSGVYLYRVKVDGQSISKQMLYIK